MAWSLQRAYPGQAVSLVAEEDAVELRAPGGEAMLGRITALVNEALAVEHPQVGGWVGMGAVVVCAAGRQRLRPCGWPAAWPAGSAVLMRADASTGRPLPARRCAAGGAAERCPGGRPD